MVKIGSYLAKTNVFLAPLSGCTDLAFRLICREEGAKFAFFEMADCHSLIYGNVKRTDIFKTTAKDRPIAAQLVGPEPALMLKAARILLKMTKPVFLDINAACPVPKMLKKKAGAHLIREPDKLIAIVSLLAAKLPLPVTVKLRTGFAECDLKGITALAKGCEAAGAAALFVHGRTREQGYSGDPDYRAIREIKESVGIPVFGSGNIFSRELSDKMLAKTGCDGVMAARGALGNPWIFREIESGPREISLAERVKVLKRHLSYVEKYNEARPGSKVGIMRKVALWYMKGFEGAPALRGKINSVQSYDEMIELIDEKLFSALPAGHHGHGRVQL